MANVAIRDLVLTDPAAGIEVGYVADDDQIVNSIRFVLTTSAVVANRGVRLVALDAGGNIFWQTVANFVQVAATTMIYAAFSGSVSISNVNGVTVVPFPAGGLRLRKGDTLRTATFNIDAGDDYSGAFAQVERADA